MQAYNEALLLLTKNGDVTVEQAKHWYKYLAQLKGCSIHSTAIQATDEAAWLKARTSGIGGSDIAAIMGESSWKSPYDIWLSKTGQLPSDGGGRQSEPARWGNVLEESVATEWAKRNNKKIVRIPVSLSLDAYPFMLANIDGFVLDDTSEIVEGILEVKTTSTYNLAAWEVGPLPYYYICQATWYTMITGLPCFDIICLVGGQRLFSYKFPKDPELCEKMQQAAIQFWNVNVMQLIEPKLTATDTERLQAEELSKAPDEVPLTNDSAEVDNVITAYLQLGEKEAAIKKMRDALKAEIYKAISGHSAMLTRNNTVVLSRISRQTCDYDLLAREYPAAFEACISSSQSIRINIK